MKKLIILLILLFAINSHAGMIPWLVGGGGSPSYSYAGFPNTAGTPSSPVGSWTAYGTNNNDRKYGRAWTATEGGELNAVNFYLDGQWTAGGVVWVTVYNGTTLAGYATMPVTAYSGEWSGYIALTTEVDYTFSTNDVLYIGCVYSSSVGAITIPLQRDGSASDGGIRYESTADVPDNGPPPSSSGSWSTSANEGLGVILRYTT